MPQCIANEMGEMVLNDEVSVVDVYDLASEIGKECEKIIDHFGSDAVTGLMPKVINALELLEALATRNEGENTRVQELSDRIAQLETEKLEKAEYRKRFEKELEAIEDQWRTESRELVTLVSRLQDENRKLSSKIQQSGHSNGDITQNASPKINDSLSHAAGQVNNLSNDGQMLQRLNAQIEKQRDELKARDRELVEKCGDVENLNLQIERLKSSGRESRRRHKLLQNQLRTLCEERADFLAQLQDQHREILSLKRSLGVAEKENEDLNKYHEENDAMRPRYTTDELKEILTERDELRSRICDLEEELKQCKPSSNLPNDDCESISYDQVEEDAMVSSVIDPSTISRPEEEDPPVQGPLPFEPDDAPWKKNSESGIRKFFRKLFSEPGPTSFPRRSLSTLSKMALSAGPHSDIPI